METLRFNVESECMSGMRLRTVGTNEVIHGLAWHAHEHGSLRASVKSIGQAGGLRTSYTAPVLPEESTQRTD